MRRDLKWFPDRAISLLILIIVFLNRLLCILSTLKFPWKIALYILIVTSLFYFILAILLKISQIAREKQERKKKIIILKFGKKNLIIKFWKKGNIFRIKGIIWLSCHSTLLCSAIKQHKKNNTSQKFVKLFDANLHLLFFKACWLFHNAACYRKIFSHDVMRKKLF